MEKASPSWRGLLAFAEGGWGLVNVSADGADQFGGTGGCFHDGIGGFGATV